LVASSSAEAAGLSQTLASPLEKTLFYFQNTFGTRTLVASPYNHTIFLP
jgi:hypothetical protein